MKWYTPDIALNGNGFYLESRAKGIATDIPSSVKSVNTGGYATAGDGGQATYSKVGTEPTHPGKFQSLDGAWWELDCLVPVPQMFGALGGNNDDTSAFTDMNSFLVFNGGGSFTYNIKHRILNNLTIGPNVSCIGAMALTGSPQDNAAANYTPLPAIKVASTATIGLLGGSGFDKSFVYRDGMTFPAPNSSAFAGTCFTPLDDDTFVTNSMILGFNKGFYSTGNQRPRLFNNYWDNNNNIEIANCLDIAYLKDNHGWPFATIASGGVYTNHTRSGRHIYLHDTCDWTKITDCFSWGYLRCIELLNVNSTTILSLGGDNAYNAGPLYANTIAIVVTGNCEDTRIIGGQAAAQATAGVYVNTTAGLKTTITDLNTWGGSSHAVLIDGGDVTINGGVARGVNSGVTINNASSKVLIDNMAFVDIALRPINMAVTNLNVIIGKNNYGNFTDAPVGGVGTCTPKTVPSAAAIAVDSNDPDVLITGTTNIGTINYGWRGRYLNLYITSALSLLHSTGTTSAIALPGNANLVLAANACVTLYHNGIQWYYVGHKS